MGILATVYAGPYAMGPEGHYPLVRDDVMFPDEFGWYYGLVVEPGKESGATPSRVVFYTPNVDSPRSGGPRCALGYTNEPPGECVGADFLRLDRDAEVKAFRDAYARELAEMAKVAGREPDFGWGVIYGYG